jgi:hypothetical protein
LVAAAVGVATLPTDVRLPKASTPYAWLAGVTGFVASRYTVPELSRPTAS